MIVLTFAAFYFAWSLLFLVGDTHRIAIYRKCLCLTLFNLLLVLPALVHCSIRFVKTSSHFDRRLCIWHLLVNLACFEILFYLTHWMFHCSFLYKLFHWQHHVLRVPIGFGAIFAHPVEFAVCNFLPASIGFLLVTDVHMITLQIWAAIAASSVVITHALEGSHTVHHMLMNKNFGTLGIMDWLFGTNY